MIKKDSVQLFSLFSDETVTSSSLYMSFMFNKQEKLYKITMILLHKTIKLTTDYHGKEKCWFDSN